jgi:F-type H+-transporting ATPase subunit b
MNIAVTLVIQGIAFFVVVLIVMRWGWPPIMAAIETRRKQIADGLAAGTRAQKDLDEAKVKAQEIIREARDKSVQIVDQASKRAAEIIEEAKQTAIAEGQRLVSSGARGDRPRHDASARGIA